MASTELGIYIVNSDGVEADKQTVLWANSASAIPTGEYVWFEVGFKNESGTLIYKTLKDSEGNVVQITEIDSYITLNFNFYKIRPYYEGSAMPTDLKVYQS